MNGDLVLQLGDQELPLTEGALRHYPRTREANGQHVVVGIRAGNLHLASSRPGPADRRGAARPY